MKRVLTYQAVRTARWLYVRWHDGARELYDLKNDPDELRSLHAGRAHRHVRHVLARRLHALATCAGDSCRR
jgi:arylsulfatase A-like enzyme